MIESSAARLMCAIALALRCAAATALTPPAGAEAPLPEGVSPSHTLLPGIYVRSETTVSITGGADAQGQLFKTFDAACRSRGLPGARLIQGRLEDLQQPTITQLYLSGERSASYGARWSLVPNRDDPQRCSFRVEQELTRIFKSFDGRVTTMTTYKGQHPPRTQTIPGDMRPLGMDQLRARLPPPPTGWTGGGPDRIAGVPCHRWSLDSAGTVTELCVPDPGSLPGPHDRGSLRSRISSGSMTLMESEVKELSMSSAIDAAVFDPAALGRAH